MKKLYLLVLVLLLLTTNSFSQININPDPNGAPWITGGCLAETSEISQESLLMIPDSLSLTTPLPWDVHNELEIWFPPIFYQEGGSCVQASEVGYIFTYEINRIRNVEAGDWVTNKNDCYHHLYTFNYLNGGQDINGTNMGSGFNILKYEGVPVYDKYYDEAINHVDTKFKYWMTGYEEYKDRFSNTIDTIYDIEFGTTMTSLEALKHWISDPSQS